MLQQPRKKRAIDWLIYAILLFLVYLCIHAYNNNDIKPTTTTTTTTTTIENTAKQDKITTQKAYIRYNQKQPTLTFQQDTHLARKSHLASQETRIAKVSCC